MKYDAIDPVNMNNGPGLRVAIWVSGCEFACPGCFNEKLWDFECGDEYTQETEDQIIEYLNHDYIDGITLIGGEPLHERNVKDLTKLVLIIRKELPDKTIWSYTGNRYEQVKDLEIVKNLDVLIDGRFILSKLDLTYKYAGSTNQRVIKVQDSIKTGEVVLYEDK